LNRNGGSEAMATDPAGETSAQKHALVSFHLSIE
jgi:hypothetical protein